MRHNQQYNGANLDILYVLLLGISILYLLALYLIEIIEPKPATVKKEANWIIEMSWPENIDCDIDLWVQDPLENKVWFNQKNAGIMHIERDDLGTSTDTVVTKNGTKYYTRENREVWTLRGDMPGRYVVSVHSYACKPVETGEVDLEGKYGAYQFMMNYMTPGTPIDVPVNVKLIRINPSYKIAYDVTVDIDKVWQEKNAMVFEIADQFAFVNLEAPFEPLVTLKR